MTAREDRYREHKAPLEKVELFLVYFVNLKKGVIASRCEHRRGNPFLFVESLMPATVPRTVADGMTIHWPTQEDR